MGAPQEQTGTADYGPLTGQHMLLCILIMIDLLIMIDSVYCSSREEGEWKSGRKMWATEIGIAKHPCHKTGEFSISNDFYYYKQFPMYIRFNVEQIYIYQNKETNK